MGDTTTAPLPNSKGPYETKLAGIDATLGTPVEDIGELWRKWRIDYLLYKSNASPDTQPLEWTEYLRRLAKMANVPLQAEGFTVLDSEPDGPFRIAEIDELVDDTDDANQITGMLLFYAVTESNKKTLSFEDVLDHTRNSEELARAIGLADTDDVPDSGETLARRWRELDEYQQKPNKDDIQQKLHDTVTRVTRTMFRYGTLPPEEVAKRHLLYPDIREEYRG